MNKIACFFISLNLLSIGAFANIETAAFSHDNFKIAEIPKNWTSLKLDDKTEILMALQPKTKKSSFTVREFKNPDPSLKKNVVSWLREYKSYGFKIVSNKPVKLNDETYGYLIQALHKKSKKVFRQYMSIKNKKLVVLTCHSNSAGDEFRDCSKSLTSFSWIAPSSSSL